MTESLPLNVNLPSLGGSAHSVCWGLGEAIKRTCWLPLRPEVSHCASDLCEQHTSLLQRLSPLGSFSSTPETAFVCPLRDSSSGEQYSLRGLGWLHRLAMLLSTLLLAAVFRSRSLHAVLVFLFLIPSTVSLFKIPLGNVCAVIRLLPGSYLMAPVATQLRKWQSWTRTLAQMVLQP